MLDFNPTTDFRLLMAVPLIPLLGYIVQIFFGKHLPRKGDWMLTGDRGAWEGDYLRFVGREDDVITSAGYRIGPAEIEDCLLKHPAVATVGVVGKPDEMRTEIVKAFVVLKDGEKPSDEMAEALQVFVKERLASYSYPREIAFLDELPMTVTGKVIRKELKARAAAEGGS